MAGLARRRNSIMEIKVPGQYPQWMADILNELVIYRINLF